MRKCAGCENEKPDRDFTVVKRGERVTLVKCRSCRAKSREHYLANREKALAAATVHYRKNKNIRRFYMRRYMADLRAKVLAKLGGVCVRCGFDDPRALQIDHVNSDGYLEIRGQLGTFAYLKKVLRDRKARYQILCANCNWIKRHEQGEQPNRRR